jgi:hypothetical protein
MTIATLRYLVWFLSIGGSILVGQTRDVYAQSKTKVAFYVVAHQDDWQLFMDAFNDLTTPKIVFVYTTAGSACGPAGNNPKGHPIPEYIARELGAQAAARALANTDRNDQAAGHIESATFAGDNQQHSILRYVFRNTVSYFLRLPESGNVPFCCDGKKDDIKNPCLLTLQSSNPEFPTLTAVDGSTTYTSWNDLVLTLTSLVRAEADPAQSSDLSFNIQDPDHEANPEDNPDHYATGDAMVKVVESFEGAKVTLYCEYYTVVIPANTLCRADDPTQTTNCGTLENKSAIFAATSFAIADGSWSSTWDPKKSPNHVNWLPRTYSRPLKGPPKYCHPGVAAFTAAGDLDEAARRAAVQRMIPLTHGFAP